MLTHINWIRGIAIVLIVFIHMADGLVYNLGPVETIAISLLTKEATCIFVVVSGFFFQLNIDKYSYQVYLTKKINNVIIPYILISIPAILIYVLEFKTEHKWVDMPAFYSKPVIDQVLFMLGTGAHLGPLWFIPALALLYLVAPLLKALSKTPVFPLLVGMGAVFFALTERPENDSNPLLAAVHFLPIYLLGMLFCQHRQRLQAPRFIPVFAALFLILSVMSCYDMNLIGLQKAALCFLLYGTLLAYREYIERRHGRIAEWLSLIGTYSFSIYFIHGYFAGAFRIISDYLTFDQFFSYLGARILLTVVTVLACIAITQCVKNVAKRNSRILIGS
ncbi:acyltransferase family protein [Pseudomonas sp. nanlin1]|uniref:acyltransferase family protein n=1 Tax=Pseudomonas sp. nanlin1 TaxID=3040605 RepID=UPI0038905489